jgi:CBS domain containing-hemolysin-like protein
MALLLFYLFLALAVSFLCSVMEAVLLSTSSPYIQNKEQAGSSRARLLRKQKDAVDRPLSAILTINTVAHTVGAAGVGAQATALFGELYFGAISAVLTLLILVFSEIIPKTIGATYWRLLALPSALVIQFMIIISFPLVWVAEKITRLFSTGNRNNVMSRSEIAATAHIGALHGTLNQHESKVIQNLLKLRTVKLKDIMTPRTVLVRAPQNITLAEFFNGSNFLSFSRIPVFSDAQDNITGYVLKSDVLEAVAKGDKAMLLDKLKRPIIPVYENISVSSLFYQLIQKKEHIAVVIDEFGTVSGIVTLEDIIETLLGLEIIDETDSAVDMQQQAKERWENRMH